ncbi:MAG: hypothetical protein NZ902_00630 [Acidilobaceae archaeon]|nr:hypothetical protein [Acidilobaceae archaeon]MCX8165337.1 hypothetical protein [Acidilobaceae archaeon]MDW7973763.1 hypothetical protein [Sulfolobales archaeon]
MGSRGEETLLFDEARRAYKEGKLDKLKDIREKLMDMRASPEVLYVVNKMIEEVQARQKAP